MVTDISSGASSCAVPIAGNELQTRLYEHVTTLNASTAPSSDPDRRVPTVGGEEEEMDAPPDVQTMLSQMLTTTVERNRHVSAMALMHAEGNDDDYKAPIVAGMEKPDDTTVAAANSAMFEGEKARCIELAGKYFGVAERREVGDLVMVRLAGTKPPTPKGEKVARRPRSSSNLGGDETLGGGLPKRWPLDAFQDRVRGIMDTYLGSQEMEEAVRCFSEFAQDVSTFLEEVVVCAVRMALQRPAKHRELIAGLLHRLRREEVLDAPAFARGFAKLACKWEELAVDDGPRAPVDLVALILGCIEADCLKEAFLNRLPEALLSGSITTDTPDRHKIMLQKVVDGLQKYKKALKETDIFEPKAPRFSAAAPGTEAYARLVSRALKEYIGMPEFHHEYVKRLFAAAFDWPTEQRDNFAQTLGHLVSVDALAIEDVQWGILRVLGALEDLSLDSPTIGDFLADQLCRIVTIDLLPEAFLSRCQMLRIGGAAGLSVLEKVQCELHKDLDAKAFVLTTEPGSPEHGNVGGPGAFLCPTQRWILAVVYEAGMDVSMAEKVCLGVAEYIIDGDE